MGPIPAGAGGTASCVPRKRFARAYPRRRGGNLPRVVAKVRDKGLSPQARGEPCRKVQVGPEQGPIPAGAGGTARRSSTTRSTRAYPRRRGGNTTAYRIVAACVGLSPQARGELAPLKRADNVRGPIPAGAGGTRQRPFHRGGGRAYPRRRGGNLAAVWAAVRDEGLSPQARGERASLAACALNRGPIPAGAGGTTPKPCAVSGIRAYPRRRGGNIRRLRRGKLRAGLSPQARGEPHGALVVAGQPGPIPAGAGGTPTRAVTAKFEGAYPRRRGGNSCYLSTYR